VIGENPKLFGFTFENPLAQEEGGAVAEVQWTEQAEQFSDSHDRDAR